MIDWTNDLSFLDLNGFGLRYETLNLETDEKYS